MTALDDFDRAASTLTGLVSAIGVGQWALPTACTEWDVRAVVNHVAHGNAKAAFWAGVGPPAPEGDYLGQAPVEAFVASVASAREVLAAPGLFERQVTTPLGGGAGGVFGAHAGERVPGPRLGHRGRDRAADGSAAGPVGPGPDAVAVPLRVGSAATGRPVRPCGGAAPGATAADRLAAFLGRKGVSG